MNSATAIEGITVDGELDVLYEDDNTGGRLRHFLIDRDRRIPLRFLNGEAPDLPSGTRVRVNGRMRDDGNLEGAVLIATGITVIGSTGARTMSTQNALVILFSFSNNPTQPNSPAAASSITDQARRLYLENSFGETITDFTVAGWFTIPATNAGCDYVTWATQAEAAASAAGYNVRVYDRQIFAFPEASSCTWWGAGNDAGPRSWVNSTHGLRVVAHERNP